MRLSFLKHLLDSVSALSTPKRIVILGSCSLLPLAPQLGGPGQPLEISLDADFLIEPIDQLTADMLEEAIGNESLFEKQNVSAVSWNFFGFWFLGFGICSILRS